MKAKSQGFLARLFEWFCSLFSPSSDRTGTSKSDDRFVSGLLDQAARCLAEALSLDASEVRRALSLLRQQGVESATTRDLLRVDCSLKKLSSTRMSVTLDVAFHKEGKLIITQIVQELPWDDLPSEIRSEFIRNNPEEIHYVICEHPDSKQNPKAERILK
jgi:hypothetical protein